MQAPSRWCRWASLPCPSVREAAFMYSTAVAVFLVILVAALQGSAPPESPFLYRIPLDPEGSLELSWNVSYAQEAIFFQLLVKQLKAGVLFGMSDRGELENADLVVLWTDGDTAYFADAWSDQKGKIHLDPQQDYQLLQVQRTPEGLALLFKRPFGTCDPKDYLIEDGTVHLVYGILEEPFQSLEAINSSGLRTGLQRVQLLKPNITFPAIPSDTCTMDIHAPDIQIPNQVTTYWCYIHELPEGFPRHHIVKYEPIVTKGNEALVHHMEIFQCAPEMDNVPHFSGPCDSKMKPDRLNYCRHVLAAWALGAKAFYYPEEAGIAFGGPGSSRYVRLEVHYHNPLVIEGRRDSSGIRLYYTDKLRRFNAGIMELGLVYTPVMAIPPRETAFVLTGYCTDKCTQLALPPSGIHIFASQLHTHLTGRKVVTVLARNGREWEIVNQDNHYSPHFQEIRMLKKVVSVHPGDVLITSCTYNTEDRELATVGGFGILEEMCVNYVHYYPQTQLELCKSAVDAGFLQKYFHLINRFNNEDVCTCPQASVSQQFASVPWNSFNREVLKALYDFAPISMHCNKSSAVRFPGEWNLQPLPKVIPTLEEPTPQCPTSQGRSPAGPTIISIGGGKG
ncbi:PREDICTED: dopamine beta-hydroxylase isoform X1 [Colobus angolensis palliatus]|uniref:Dopamine beta-hydroxylase n=1 Tax=Colobus angolensis palliatus TaxID=336983 RepID=A0A2K5K8D2_COLAP|nr:PREDICTED: dopamine beta-hydroxylase isoform X1 [Colobus angolensis palliatus]